VVVALLNLIYLPHLDYNLQRARSGIDPKIREARTSARD
jgi:hypothetical protein